MPPRQALVITVFQHGRAAKKSSESVDMVNNLVPRRATVTAPILIFLEKTTLGPKLASTGYRANLGPLHLVGRRLADGHGYRMRKTAILLAGAAVAALTALSAIRPASALPATNGPVGFADIESALEDTGDITFKTISRVYPVTVSINSDDLTFLEQPNDSGSGSIPASLDLRFIGVVFSFRQAETGPIPEPGSLALLSS